MIFRYPGGKTRLLPALRPYLDALAAMGSVYVEPFVGGGSTVFDFARRHPRHSIVVNDLDPWMAAFWRIIAQDDEPSELYECIQAKPTVELFEQLRATPALNDQEKAYYAIFFNRTTFSGILTSGPIGGYKTQDSTRWPIHCRYNPDALRAGIRNARDLLGGRLTALEVDAVGLVYECRQPMYLDPPYFVKGNMLYRETVEHVALADILRDKGEWALSYDDAPEIRAMYGFASIEFPETRYGINGRKSAWTKAQELIIVPAGVLPRRLLEQRPVYDTS